MRRHWTQLTATVVLVMALLAPFAGGWAMALGVAEGRILVICTGDGLRTIHIDENGDATEISRDTVNCVLKSATDTANPVDIDAAPYRLLYVQTGVILAQADAPATSHVSHFARAPPVT